jgi:hypothetical protein
MQQLTSQQIIDVSGAVAPLLVFYGAYTLLMPAFALGFANGLAEK